MKFDPTISLGTILHLIVLVVTLIAAYWKMRELVFKLHNEALAEMNRLHGENVSRLQSLETKMAALWDWFKRGWGGGIPE